MTCCKSMPMARVMYVSSRLYGRSWTQVRKRTPRMFRYLDPLELTGATCQIRYTHCFPSSSHSCSHAHHRIPLFPSGSMYTGPESQLAHHACHALRFRRECTSAQDVLTSLRHCKA